MSTHLRVLSYNLHGLRDDTAALARVVRRVDPDVVLVQEAPKYWQWRAKCAALARDCGLLYVIGGGTTGGTALLAHLRVDVKRAEQSCLSRQWGWPARGVAAAVVARSGASAIVASLHFPLDADQRLEHAHRAMNLCLGLGDGEVIVGGDINERPGRAAWQALEQRGFRDLGPGSGPTFPAVVPSRRIDGILGTAGVQVSRYEVVDHPDVVVASDHRPVVADVVLPGAT